MARWTVSFVAYPSSLKLQSYGLGQCISVRNMEREELKYFL